MKKIIIVILLLQNWSVFGQTQVKLNLGALAFKRLDVSLEQTRRHFSIGLTGEYSKPDLNIYNYNKNGQVPNEIVYQKRIGYGGEIRWYINNPEDKTTFFIGTIARFNTQKFEFKNLIFQRNEKFIGLSSGFKIRINKYFLIETSGSIGVLSGIKIKDISRNFDIQKINYPSSGWSSFFGQSYDINIDLEVLNKSSKNYFLGNFAIIYQF